MRKRGLFLWGIVGLLFLFGFTIGMKADCSEEGLVAYWPMDEGEGNVVKDKSGNGNDGVIYGATWVAGKKGYGLSFDGVNDYVDCGNKPAFNIRDGLTIKFWLKPDIPTGPNRRILSKGDTGLGEPGGYQYLIYQREDTIHFHLSNGTNITDIGTSVKIGIMQHLAFTWDGKTMKIFLDGQIKASSGLSGPLNSNDNGIGLYIGGRKNLYFKGIIDEVKIYNRALSDKEIAQEQSEISPGKITSLENSFTALEKRGQSLTNMSPAEEYLQQRIKTALTSMEKKIKNIKEKRGVTFSELNEIEKMELALLELDKVLTRLEKGQMKSKCKGLLTYIVPPISNTKIFPDSIFIDGEVTDTILLVASPGEYEPASFIIHPYENINSLKVTPTDLKREKESIPASNIDIKVVKWWYQSGEGSSSPIPVNQGRKFFLPELLLNDDNLVKVDTEKEENYLKLIYPEGEKYLCISQEEGIPGISGQPSVDEFPVKDATNLLPVNISAKTNKQFWITVKVPEDAEAGIYTGKINLSTPEEFLGSITIKLKVLPFKLCPPYYTSSIYYRGCLDSSGKGTISSELKNRQQFKAELTDMYIHGVTNPIIYQPLEELDEVLKIRREVGIDNCPLYYLGLAGEVTKVCANAELLPSYLEKVKKVIDMAKCYGISEVYFYGMDEATGKQLTSQRAVWEATHKAGGKVFVAGYRDSNFPLMGDIQDLLVCAYYPSKEEAAKWHSVGHKIWCYANPQGGVEEPLTYRRNFGLLLWQKDYDGAATYAYQNGIVGTLAWNDFEKGHCNCRHHNMTYPVINGVVDTIQWEGYREGVDDVRYLTTLLKTIEEAKKIEDKTIKAAVISAEKYLAELKETDLSKRDLSTVRLEIINHILKLSNLVVSKNR